MRTFWHALVCLSLLLGVVTGDLRAEDYAIKLTTPYKAGQKYYVKATASDSRMNALFSDGRILKQETETKIWEFASGIEIIAINDKGQPTQVALRVAKLSQVETGKTNELLAAGSVVSMTYKDGRKVFQHKGAEVPAQLNAILSTCIEISNLSEPTDDEVFGTAERKKVGEQWKVNVELGVKALQRDSFKIDPAKVTGIGKLEALTEVNGVKCLRVNGGMFIKDVGVTIPNGMVARSSTLEVRVSGAFPVNGLTGRLQSSESLNLDFNAVGKTKDEHEIQLKATAERKVERLYSY